MKQRAVDVDDCRLPGSSTTIPKRPASLRQNAMARKEDNIPVWWSNAILFCAWHIIALSVLWRDKCDYRAYILCYINWQLATLGITVGYHRLWSHRSYDAHPFLRAILAVCGTIGFQGSIKWWVLRHRLHHRFTDTSSDPYSASRGLLHSHVGWIFFKPRYSKMRTVDQSDLNADLIVILQHRYYVPLALTFGLALPAIMGKIWFGSALDGLLWGGFVARILIWHCTFFVNSLAHYIGEQEYEVDVTARGNFLLALLTNGEGWHNYHHSFPCDYRNGVRLTDWDPTKWIIASLYRFTPLISSVRSIPRDEISQAKARVAIARATPISACTQWPSTKSVPSIPRSRIPSECSGRPCLVIDGYVVDVSSYFHQHPGGEGLLRASFGGRDASIKFQNLNHHSAHARSLVESMRVAKIIED